MNKTVLTSFTILCLLFTAFLIGVSYNIQPVKASGTIHIRADGTIEPSDAPILTVDNVTYTFTDNINDSIVVQRGGILIDGASYTLEGTGKGIDLSHRSNVTVKNTEIKGFTIGIYLWQSSNNTISENNMTSNFYGIRLDQSSNNILSVNRLTRNWAGIYLSFSPDNMIFHNEFVGCGLSIDSFPSIVTNNTVNGKSLVYLKNVSDYVISYAGQVILINCENIRVEGVDLSNASFGIGLCQTSNTKISNNNITNNVIGGISLMSSSNNIISGNKITNNTIGIDLWQSFNNTLSGNIMNGNKCNLGVSGGKLEDFLHFIDVSNIVDGKPVYYWVNRHGNEVPLDAGYVALVNCTEITVRNLTLTNNGEGVSLAFTRNSYISNNTLTNNSYGMYLVGSSNNSISRNNISANFEGIRLFHSSSDKIFNNNFIDNSIQTDCYDSTEVWDNGYPSGGNYWSNYIGVDVFSGPHQNETGYDWIGDSPYTIDENNQDKYPLMYPFVPEMEEIRIAYRNLLLEYYEILSDLDTLNSTLHKLLSNITDLQGKYDSLLNTIKGMQESIDDLMITFNSTSDDLQEQIDSLNSTFERSINNLQDRVDLLNSTLQERINSTQTSIDNLRKDLMIELSTIRNLMYIFIATTVILIATTVYLAVRKPKTKPQTK